VVLYKIYELKGEIKMKVQELLMNIHNNNFNLENGLQVKKYLPIEVKKTIAHGIIYECINDEDGAIKVDSVQRYLAYVRYMITMHTNLEYTDDDYDALCSTEYGNTTLLNTIIECFGEDANECSRILNLVTDDYMMESSIEFAIAKFLNGLNNSISDLVNKINHKIDDVNINDIVPNEVDKEQLSAFLRNYIK
jgi:hypothetical protein